MKEKIKLTTIKKENYGLLEKSVLDNIVTIGMDAFGFGMTEKEILEHIYPTDKLYLAFCGEEIVGFATLTLKEYTADLTGAAVKTRFQRNGIYKALCSERVQDGLDYGDDYFELRTQNPNIELTVRKVFDEFVARPDNNIQSYEIERELKKELYGRMLTATKPLSGVKTIDEMYNELNYEKGDAYRLRIKTNKPYTFYNCCEW
ncbi:MAG: GNAT family N-acetyltransferase [Nanoarchaeota archaeon]|nr:GNAT family N-acetyltransferase [Nanoarchaeota archaeon]MBU1269054.1 GNAT family N-acetyltransferase [Nanoarchaeota archaeon]MBU1604949.1 GNAT family N-acetyltransferase [Nanoarchaeota archaeon]MBU2443321.1 GNAT family N-acetyltransferase [Nanoarchaeota archaeon]